MAKRGACCDEASAQPDVEIFRACAPALSASNGIWIGTSTGYRNLGSLYQRWRDHYGADGDGVLVCRAHQRCSTRASIRAMIERIRPPIPERMGGVFRNDISAFLDDATIEAAIDYGRPSSCRRVALGGHALWAYERSEKNKSEIYVESLPLWARNAEHPHLKLNRELRLLESRTRPMLLGTFVGPGSSNENIGSQYDKLVRERP